MSRRVLLDANVLLLLLVGEFDRELVAEFKRTRNQLFTADDFDLLRDDIVAQHSPVVTTPHILAEVSNLSASLVGEARDDYFAAFAAALEVIEEQHVPALSAVNDPIFRKFGLTDAGISRLYDERQGLFVVTVDAPLCDYLQQKGMYAFNFNRIKLSGWNMTFSD
jgi:hypothetical protein